MLRLKTVMAAVKANERIHHDHIKQFDYKRTCSAIVQSTCPPYVTGLLLKCMVQKPINFNMEHTCTTSASCNFLRAGLSSQFEVVQ